MKLFFVGAMDNVDEKLLQSLNDRFTIWFEGFTALCPFQLPGTKLGWAHKAKAQLHDMLFQMIETFKTSHGKDSSDSPSVLSVWGVCGSEKGLSMIDSKERASSAPRLSSNIFFVSGGLCTFLLLNSSVRKILSSLCIEHLVD